MPTFYLRSLNSDLAGGADFNKKILTGTPAGPTVGLPVSVAGGATEDSYGFSEPNKPWNADWEAGNWTVVAYFSAANFQVGLSISISRISASGTVIQSTAFTAVQWIGSVGAYTFTFTGIDLSTVAPLNATDRIRITFRFTNSSGSARSVTLDSDTTATYANSPVTLGAYPVSLGGDLSFDGTLTNLKEFKRTLDGSLGLAGSLVRSLDLKRELSGDLNFDGVAVGVHLKEGDLGGSLSMSGELKAVYIRAGHELLYKCLALPIREADAKTLLLKDYLEGKQLQYELLKDKATALFSLGDIFTQTNREVLLALLWQLGFEGEKQQLFEGWTVLQLQRLLSVVSALWRSRGTQASIEAILRIFLPDSQFIIRDWFWYRAILGETWLEGHNSPDAFWLVTGVGLGLDEFTSDIYIVAEKATAGPIIEGPMNLIRGNSERFNVCYVSFIDQFDLLFDQWQIVAGSPSIEGGMLRLGDGDKVYAKDRWLKDSFALFTTLVSSGATFEFHFRCDYSGGGDCLILRANETEIAIFEKIGGPETKIGSVTDPRPIYGIRRDWLVEVQGDKVLLFFDGDLIIQCHTNLGNAGGFGFTSSGAVSKFDDFICAKIPFDTGYIGPG